MSENAVPKIEGHAAFYTHLKNGQVDKARMIGLENDRFVEKILFGRKYWEAPIITSRICGICPTIHSTTAIQAIEKACSITPSHQTKELRRLLLAAQTIQSHSLHLYLLALPDFVGVSSSFELQKSHPAFFQNAIMLKRFADNTIEAIGGRAVHPIADVPGGFKHLPEKEKLKELMAKVDEIIEISKQTVEVFANFHLPEMKHDIIFSALSNEKRYDLYEGIILNSKNKEFHPEHYHSYIYEELKPYTRAKFGTYKGEEMMVGAISRLRLNGGFLNKDARAYLEKVDFQNPFYNNLAQAIEMYHFAIESKKILEQLLKEGIDYHDGVKPPVEFGEGVGACEAPRGTLFHYYKLDKEGSIIECDIITPTVQNLPTMEFDMKELGPTLAKLDKEEQTKMIEMLIRAYDPCITCATH